MSAPELISAGLIREINDLIARPQRLRVFGTSLAKLLSTLDDSKLPGIWKPDAIAMTRIAIPLSSVPPKVGRRRNHTRSRRRQD